MRISEFGLQNIIFELFRIPLAALSLWRSGQSAFRIFT
jgi:hypothetical protein